LRCDDAVFTALLAESCPFNSLFEMHV